MSDALAPYVPRLVVDWVADEPERRHRTVAGTLVFADISGFTALTERLAVRGKAGAEEMSDLLNAVFDKLLTAAYDFGANLIKWGGDAVLLLFDGERHATRAAAAAWSMQAVMRGLGKLQTSAGPVRLGMSIGMNTGEIDFMLVGSLHRELIVTGPTASHTAVMEQQADRGDVLMSPVTASLMPAACRGDAKADGVLLKRSPEIPERPNRLPKRAGVDVGIAMCSQLREHLRHGHTEFEHRSVTVGFIELSGTDDLLAEHGPGALTVAVAEAVAVVQDAAADNGVTMLSSDVTVNGIKIILTAGVPVAAGDDETRVLSALRQIVKPRESLRVRAGVTQGSVFAGDYGPFYRKTYSITGDIVNLAARLMSKAEPGQIVALPDVVERSRTHFETTPLAPFQAKGKSEPVLAVVVGAALHAADRPAVEPTELIGREAELAILLDAVDLANRGHGQVVEIVGPPGMGKSRLTDELVTRASARVLWADGDIYARATPYQPMQRLLRRTLGTAPEATDLEVGERIVEIVETAAPDLAPWLPLIGIVGGVELPSTPEVEILDPEVRRARLESTTSDLLGRLLLEPVVFVFNDVQFMDEATIAFIRRLANDCTNRPWLLVLTCRPDVDSQVPDAENVHRMVLQPLAADDADRLISVATENAPLPSHRMRQLVERAGGNPLFLQQLVAGALGGADLDELPDSVEGMIAARIDTVPLLQRRWLRAASVLGNTIDPDLLAKITEDDSSQPWDGLEEFIVLGEDHQLRFHHHLVRLTAYQGLPFRRRTQLHARAADVLEAVADHDVALLSLHCFNGGQYEQAWRYSRLAADQARDAYAPTEAAALYARALEAAGRVEVGHDDEVTDVYEALAEVRLDLGEMGDAEIALRQARARAKADPLRLAALRLKTARHRQHTGRHADALRWVTSGRSALRGIDGESSMRLLAELAERGALIRYDQGAYKAAKTWADRAVREAQLANDRLTEARGLGVSAVLGALAGLRWDEASVGESLALYEEAGDLRGKARAANRFGMCAYFAGQWDTAVRYYAVAEEASRQIGRDFDVAAAATNRAEVLVQQGRASEAEPLLATTIWTLRAAQAMSYVGFALTISGRVCVALGEFEAAMVRLSEARELSLEMGEVDESITVDALIAECHLRLGEATLALAQSEAAMARSETLGVGPSAEPHLLRVKGEALIELGDHEGGRASLRASLDSARERRASVEIATTLATLLRLAVAQSPREAVTWESEWETLVAQLGIVSGR